MPITPSMALNLPVPSVDPGPEWATELNEALEVVDQHDHTAGKGNQVPTAGLNLDADLPFNANKATELKSTQYDPQSIALSGAPEANSGQSVAGDFWWTNGSGVPVQITSGASVVAAASTNTPAGIILPYAGSSAPAGYLLADGTAVSRVTYSTLFGVVGTTFGVGDGSTTFNLPNMSGRVPMGAGTYTDPVSGSLSRTLGQEIGAAAHALSTGELASHNHGGGSHEHLQYAALTASAAPPDSSNFAAQAADYGANNFNYATSGTSTAPTVGRTSTPTSTPIATQGSNTPHNTMQPSLGLNYIIKT